MSRPARRRRRNQSRLRHGVRYGYRPRRRNAAARRGVEVRRLALAAAALLLAVWVAGQALPVHGTPDGTPPRVGSMLPVADTSGSPRTGIGTSLTLRVDSCREPVRGSVLLVVPRRHFARWTWRDGTDRAAAALAAVTISDPNVRFMAQRVYVRAADGRRLATTPNLGVDARVPAPVWEFRKATRGRSYAMPLQDWPAWGRGGKYAVVAAEFEARWLRPRGLRSCWLALPQTLGPDAYGAALDAAPSVDYAWRMDSRLARIGPATQRVHVRNSTGDMVSDWVPERVRAAIVQRASIAVTGKLEVADDQPQLSGPLPGLPRWECEAPRAQALYAQVRSLPGSHVSGVSHADSTRCSGWVAMTEPGADTWRDAALILAGALFSVFAALITDTLLTVGRTRA